jgi:phosphohistidine swiveling domain-containing protein
MSKYKKGLIRDMELMACEYWFRGEFVELSKLCKGLFYFTPLFVYQPGKATSVYYDLSDKNQDPNNLVNFLLKHPNSFDKFAEKWMKVRDELMECVKRKSVNDFKKLFSLISEFWPLMDCAWALCDGAKAPEELAKKAFDLRAKTERVVWDAGFLFYDLAKQIISSDDVLFMTFDEFVKGSIPKDIELRKKGYVYYMGKVYTPESVELFAKEHNIVILEDKVGDVSDVKGIVACKGVVRGVARIVLERSQLGKVNVGDVLVSSMTTPDFLPAMSKAAAFVTDEGGITCHASIVAREMKKPCVIGTKISTRVFKDGDLIEVDAEKGVVRKIL